MGEKTLLQPRGTAVICLLAGTAAVALAATYYNRNRLSKRPHNDQQSAKLQQLLAEVIHNDKCYPERSRRHLYITDAFKHTSGSTPKCLLSHFSGPKRCVRS